MARPPASANTGARRCRWCGCRGRAAACGAGAEEVEVVDLGPAPRPPAGRGEPPELAQRRPPGVLAVRGAVVQRMPLREGRASATRECSRSRPCGFTRRESPGGGGAGEALGSLAEGRPPPWSLSSPEIEPKGSSKHRGVGSAPPRARRGGVERRRDAHRLRRRGEIPRSSADFSWSRFSEASLPAASFSNRRSLQRSLSNAVGQTSASDPCDRSRGQASGPCRASGAAAAGGGGEVIVVVL